MSLLAYSCYMELEIKEGLEDKILSPRTFYNDIFEGTKANSREIGEAAAGKRRAGCILKAKRIWCFKK